MKILFSKVSCLRIVGFLCLLLTASGCDRGSKFLDAFSKKSESPDATGKEREASVGQDAMFQAEYQKWQAKAVEEFPALGVAGSPLNQQFLKEAKLLMDRAAPELKHSNWPYVLALQIHAQSVRTQDGRLNNAPPPGEVRSPASPAR